MFLFFGKLHPLMVHLPIGILCAGILFYLLSRLRRFEFLIQSVYPILTIGFFSSLISAVAGYLLSQSGNYNPDLIVQHQYAGIFVTLVSGCLVLQLRHFKKTKYPNFHLSFSIQLIGLFALVLEAGHQGGSLTHGTDYLSVSRIQQEISKPASADSALVFEHVVLPILRKRCASCHGTTKQKGALSLISLAQILKGGESGPAIIPGKPSESEIIKRISLDPAHEDFMPAEGKTPLTKSEAAILYWWISQGKPLEGKKLADYSNQIEIHQEVQQYLGFSKSENSIMNSSADVRAVPDPKKLDAVDNLRKTGVMVRILQHAPLRIDITIPPNSNLNMEHFSKAIEPLENEIIWLKLSENNLNEGDLTFLARLTNLQKLRLEKNPIGDGISGHLKNLRNLEAINLNETRITKNGLMTLRQNSAVKRIYHWQTPASLQP